MVWMHNIYILKQQLYNYNTKALKAYVSLQPSSLSAFIFSKPHTVPHGRQLNTKVCGSKSTNFGMNVVLITVLSSMTTKHLHSYSPWLNNLFIALPGC